MPHREQPLRVPDPILSRSRKSAFKRVVRSLFTIALVTGVIVGGAIVFAYTQFTAKGPLLASTVYQVNQGLKRAEIGAAIAGCGHRQQRRHIYGGGLCEGRVRQPPQGRRV